MRWSVQSIVRHGQPYHTLRISGKRVQAPVPKRRTSARARRLCKLHDHMSCHENEAYKLKAKPLQRKNIFFSDKQQHPIYSSSAFSSLPISRSSFHLLSNQTLNMKLSITLLSSLLFATTIIASPSAARGQRWNERRANSERATKVNNLERGTDTSNAAASTSTNKIWSGAVVTASPPGTTFTAVGATFVVPKPSPPTSGPGTWGGSAWVGIDGYYSNLDALLQAGVSWGVTVSDTGATTYNYTGKFCGRTAFLCFWLFCEFSQDLDVSPNNSQVEHC
jgi:Peptidase A4 family